MEVHLSMSTSPTINFKRPRELHGTKRKLSPERSVLADITNSTPKRFAVITPKRQDSKHTALTKDFMKIDVISKREVCMQFAVKLKGCHIYLSHVLSI
jgi:hypothetical protein